VSNISFGLPARDAINGTFFAMALTSGLSAAIMNPHSPDMMRTYHTYRALKGLDESFAGYIRYAETLPAQVGTAAPVSGAVKKTGNEGSTPLQKTIIKGLREQAATLTSELLATTPALTVVQSEIIPALDIVGQGFERKTTYIPQLLMAAEAAKAAFEVIKSNMTAGGTAADSTKVKMPIVLATVKGDIHDIGKNIVRLLLENYGYPVTDLGRDVPPEAVVEAAVKLHAPLVGLSALMTTTVPAMEETIQVLRRDAPWCKIVVGGAVLTPDYAAKIGADKYAADAMETVRYAEELSGVL
jgi:5-methyltetrahydrofolate--homocysteine methyltransferase